MRISGNEHGLEPGIYLEVGVGGDSNFGPNPTMLIDAQATHGPRRFTDGAQYIGIDRPRQSDRYWLAMHAWMTGEALDKYDYEGSIPETAGQLAVARTILQQTHPGQSVNLLAADAHALPFPDESVREIYACDVLSSQLGNDSIGRILQEAKRVLQADGRLVTRECYTPQWLNEAQLRTAAVQAGLQVAATTYHGSSSYEALAQEFGATSFEINPDMIREGSMYFGILARS
ncbi:MAG TPA: methyltransferase domain-containing protein [Candidatus Saccharimonadales bacterium]|nr:methyltransferase domain-containing protein [Candidatus Saccharimonadales bacterium]